MKIWDVAGEEIEKMSIKRETYMRELEFLEKCILQLEDQLRTKDNSFMRSPVLDSWRYRAGELRSLILGYKDAENTLMVQSRKLYTENFDCTQDSSEVFWQKMDAWLDEFQAKRSPF